MTGQGITAPGSSVPEGFERRTICPLCRAPSEHAPVYIAFRDIPVVKCAGCGFIHPSVAMTAEGMKRYYREVFASPWHRKGQELNAYVNEAILRKVPGFMSSGATAGVRSFLDVGTGYGFLLSRFKQRGIECVGTEPSVEEARWGNANLGVRIVNTFLADSGLPKASFDCAACFEVIEHTPDPCAFVAEMAEFVRPGGMLIINTDNFESAAVRTLGPRFAKWIPHSHVSDFAPATLRRCIESVPGLRVESALSYTAWENALRACLARFKPPADPAACFDLKAELGREMKRTYALWPLRLAMARAWTALTLRRDAEGSMMYLVARKG